MTATVLHRTKSILNSYCSASEHLAYCGSCRRAARMMKVSGEPVYGCADQIARVKEVEKTLWRDSQHKGLWCYLNAPKDFVRARAEEFIVSEWDKLQELHRLAVADIIE